MKTVISALVTDEEEDGKETFILFCEDGYWGFVGGTPKEKENEVDCVARKIKEEIPHLVVSPGEYVDQFDGVSPTDKQPFKMLLYHFIYIKGPTSVKSGSELKDSGRFTFEEAMELNLSEVTREALKKWKEDHDE